MLGCFSSLLVRLLILTVKALAYPKTPRGGGGGVHVPSVFLFVFHLLLFFLCVSGFGDSVLSFIYYS